MRLALLSILCLFCATLATRAQTGTIRGDSSSTPLQLSFAIGSETVGPVPFGPPTDWGADLKSPLSAELAWGFTVASDTIPSDSLGCSALATDLTGKIALLRRGACAFTAKAINAEAAGAIGFIIVNSLTENEENSVINMSGGSPPPAVGIPGASVSYNTGLRLTPALDSGELVTVSFNPVGTTGDFYIAQSSVIPLSQAAGTFDGYGARFATPTLGLSVVELTNVTGNDSIFTATLNVIDPDGSSSVVGTTLDTIPADSTEILLFDNDPITYSKLGTYSYFVTSTLDNQVTDTPTVVISPNFFQTVPEIIAQGASVATESFDAADKQVRFGMVVDISESVNAESVSFGICNGAELIDSVRGSTPVITASIYDIDLDNDGLADTAFSSVDVFTPDNEIGFGEYTITGEETCAAGADSLITIAIESSQEQDSVVLEAGKIYVVAVRIQSQNEGSGVQPVLQSSDNGASDYITFAEGPTYGSTFLEFDQKFTGYGTTTLVTRLTVSDNTPVSTKQLPELSGSFRLFPNPANDLVSMSYSLDGPSSETTYSLVNAQGQAVLGERSLTSQAGTLDISTGNLPTGLYSVVLKSDHGVKALRLAVEH